MILFSETGNIAGGTSFSRGDSEFGFGHVVFEIPMRNLSGDVQKLF